MLHVPPIVFLCWGNSLRRFHDNTSSSKRGQTPRIAADVEIQTDCNHDHVRAVLGSFWITSAFVSTTYFWNDNVTTIIGCTAPFICLSISALSYAKMCQSLRRRHVQIACKNKNIPINIARYKKTVSTAIYIQLFFVVCYLPYGIVTTVLAVSGLKPSLVLPWASSYCLLLINSSINPFLCIWRIRDVRQAVKNTIRWNN